MKIESIPEPGRDGDVVYYNGRCGNVKRQHGDPRNPRTLLQQDNRGIFGAVSKRWRALNPEQLGAWRISAAQNCFITETGEPVRRNCYHLFLGINTRRAVLGLSQFDLPPPRPAFGSNPVAELVIDCTRGEMRLKLRVSRPPEAYILVQGPAPKRSGIRVVQHFPLLGLLPLPLDGWSDITELYVGRYGLPKLNTRIWIRTCQHLDGWIDVPKVLQARVLAPTP
jgi:hypothetical protein